MKAPYPHPIIAREGWPYIVGVALVSLLCTMYLSAFVALPLYVVLLFVIQFFRDPPRVLPPQPGIVSPADGRIVAVMPCLDPYLNCEAIKISVFMNVFNVHSNRSPVHGVVEDIRYFRGSFVNADLDKASEANERNALIIRADNKQLLSCVQVAGLIARRILCYVKVGQQLSPGERYGFIRFGSRVDLYLPLGSVIKVAIGDRVWAGSTLLAEWGE
ncbi:phosphatidylserine decarboxylase proenzyme [Ferrovum sp. JA12]|uniref:phosphatidylserine decarboxylase n=1 Tax=Ferrovum sp. JA12 TaxID=1356299 RepID=UPI000702DBF4|nr:phosphatidylserine decarboxylase [Ferrovum sp. JA12]KRH78007.1 phosphatidylserine decarboxylase proenzyme [Ferrovum sp. JA12]